MEVLSFRGLSNPGENIGRVEFGDGPATLANEQGRRSSFMGSRTGDKGIAAFDLVDKAVGLQKIKGTINRDWGGANAAFGHALDHIISAGGRMALCHAGQHITALPGELAAPPGTGALGPGDQIGGAIGVVVMGRWEGHGCYNITCLHELPVPFTIIPH